MIRHTILKDSSIYLLIILLLSIFLNLWGINWGLPERWHPDEMTGAALEMGYYKHLNPHHFAYGSLHYYQIMLFIAPVHLLYIAMNLNNYITELHILWLFSRILSAFLGTSIVVIIYLIAKELFDKKSGLLSALLLTVSMGFVNLSHFATSDIPSIFWFSISCLMSTYVLTRKDKKYYFLAGLFIGFAAASKYNAGLALVALIVAHFLNKNGLQRYLIYGIFAAIVGFIVANPVLFISCCEFIEGFLKDNFFNSLSRFEETQVWLPFISRLRDALGTPLFFVSVLGILYSLKLLFSINDRSRVLLLWSMFLPYYFLFGSIHKISLRYVVPIVPFILILAGKMISDIFNIRIRFIRLAFSALLIIVVGYSLIFTIASDLEFIHDSRLITREWIRNIIPYGSSIEITSYGPNIPSDKFSVRHRPHKNKVDKTVSLIKSNPTYLLSQKILLRFQSFAERFNLCDGGRPYYVAWYEKAMNRYKLRTEDFDVSVEGLNKRKPDYLIVSSQYFKRFSDDKESAEGKFYDSLFSGNSDYTKVAEFKYRFHPWIDPNPEFVNPLIIIFERNNTS